MNEEERDMTECIIVGMGGFIGAVCRYLVGLLPVKESFVFPIKTFGINIIGCFLIGIIAALALKNSALDPRWILFLKVGICGGFKHFHPLRWNLVICLEKEMCGSRSCIWF